MTKKNKKKTMLQVLYHENATCFVLLEASLPMFIVLTKLFHVDYIIDTLIMTRHEKTCFKGNADIKCADQPTLICYLF